MRRAVMQLLHTRGYCEVWSVDLNAYVSAVKADVRGVLAEPSTPDDVFVQVDDDGNVYIGGDEWE